MWRQKIYTFSVFLFISILVNGSPAIEILERRQVVSTTNPVGVVTTLPVVITTDPVIVTQPPVTTTLAAATQSPTVPVTATSDAGGPSTRTTIQSSSSATKQTSPTSTTTKSSSFTILPNGNIVSVDPGQIQDTSIGQPAIIGLSIAAGCIVLAMVAILLIRKFTDRSQKNSRQRISDLYRQQQLSKEKNPSESFHHQMMMNGAANQANSNNTPQPGITAVQNSGIGREMSYVSPIALSAEPIATNEAHNNINAIMAYAVPPGDYYGYAANPQAHYDAYYTYDYQQHYPAQFQSYDYPNETEHEN